MMKKKLLLSVIVPAYNEKKTFSIVIKKLLKIRIKNVKLEIIIVESNSTDGTREDVLKFKNNHAQKIGNIFNSCSYFGLGCFFCI